MSVESGQKERMMIECPLTMELKRENDKLKAGATG